MSWHTLYRPRSVGQLHSAVVRQRLENLLASGSFPQVLLLAGPKGTGKTSTARILGAVLNDPINAAAVEQLFFVKDRATKVKLLDTKADYDLAAAILGGKSFVVQELDAASNRGIDDVRQLRERAQVPPSQGKMSVFILDEAHMLTTEAFNALLKLLEEPPPHALFVLATTELHKIPPTIVSRATTILFQVATLEEVEAALTTILKQEHITASDEVLKAIAQQAEGSYRDAVKLLEEAAAGQTEVTLERLATIRTPLDQTTLQALLKAVVAKNEHSVVQLIEQIRLANIPANVVYKTLLTYLHTDLKINMGLVQGQALFNQRISLFLLTHLQDLIEPPLAPIPLLALELKLLELVFKAKQNGDPAAGSSAPSSVSPPPVRSTPLASSRSAPTSSSPATSQADETETASSDDSPFTSDNLTLPEEVDTLGLLESWQDFVKLVEQKNTTIAALLRSATPRKDKSNGKAVVEVYYAFHKDQLSQPRFMSLLQDCAATMLGARPPFEFILASKPEVTATSPGVLTAAPRLEVAVSAGPALSATEPDLAALAGEALM